MIIPMNGMTFTVLLCVIFVLAVALYSVIEHYKAKVNQLKANVDELIVKIKEFEADHSIEAYKARNLSRKRELEVTLKALETITLDIVQPYANEDRSNVTVASIFHKLVRYECRTLAKYKEIKDTCDDN